jgi:hypothetical protein
MWRSRSLLSAVGLFGALGLVVVGCGDTESGSEALTTTTTEATTTTATTTAPSTTSVTAVDSSFAAYCEKNMELIEVRGQVYGPPFDETPQQIEALLAEAAALNEELLSLMPAEIREQAEYLTVAFDGAIDAMTEEEGWDPYAAMNSEAAAAIFSDPEIGAAIEEMMAFNDEHCGPMPTS